MLPGVLWAYEIISKISTGETLFLLVYGTEVLILVEIGEPSQRYNHASELLNDEALRTDLDMTEERRELSLI